MAAMLAAEPLWLGVIGALAPVGAGLAVLIGVIVTVRQRDAIDQREQWWKRVEWSAGLVASSDESSRVLGMSALLSLISEMRTMDDGDAELLWAIVGCVDLSRFSTAAE